MGGYSSGRVGWRPKCENLLAIDVRRWAREGYLSRHYFGWQWTTDGEQVSSIGVWGHADRIELQYTKDEEKYRYPVWLTSSRCHFGGARRWFVCPVVGCGRRVAKLYLGSRHFACRRCYNLAYQSQCYAPYDRALQQAGKIRLRLGGEAGIAYAFPDKPKRMRWRTYERLQTRCERYEAYADERLAPLLLRLASELRLG